METYVECNESIRDVFQEMENSSAEKGISVLNAFVKYYESSLYNEIEKPARHLHNSLSSFQREEKFSTLTKNDIPNGRECLKFEVNVTEQAAQILLETIKECISIWLAICEKAPDLFKRWPDKLNANQQSITSKILRKLLAVAKEHAIQVQCCLNDIPIAQEYQVITEHIINKAIGLVQEFGEYLRRIVLQTGHADSLKQTEISNY